MDFQGDGIFKRVLDSGIDLTKEPFHRLQLLALYRFHVKEVLSRTMFIWMNFLIVIESGLSCKNRNLYRD